MFLDPYDPEVHARGRAGRHPARLDRRRAALADLGPDQHLRGRAAAAPGVPHDADGLVHPAAVAVVDVVAETGEDAEDTGNLFAAIDALRIPVEYLAELFTAGDAGAGDGGAQEARRDALLHARHQHGPRPRDASIPAAVGMTEEDDVRHVPAARDRQVRRALRHPGRARRAGARPGGARHRVQPRLRRRPRHGRLRAVRRGLRRAPTPIAVENFHMLAGAGRPPTRSPTRRPGRRGSTCSTGTARARRRAVPAQRPDGVGPGSRTEDGAS